MLELFLLGSGRFIQIGPLTLRMILFLIVVFYSAVRIAYTGRIDREIILLLSIFIVVHSLDFLVGIMNNADMSLILNDIKPLLFFLMIIFFSAGIRDIKDVHLTVKTIKAAGLILALPYLIFLLLSRFGIIHLDSNIIAMLENHTGGDIRFQQHFGVFYNGFFYLCIGFFFFAFEKGKVNKIIALLFFAAVVLTFSRGLLLCTVLTVLIYDIIRIIRSKQKMKYLVYVILICCAVLLSTAKYFDIVGAKHIYLSDSVRITTFRQVFDAVTPLSLFVGHGLGIGVAQRPVHMEISYLEIFHKQGIIGLLFWFVLFVVIVQQYYKASRNGTRHIALPFMLSCLFTFIVTATNNYMNNPVGMPVLLISITVLNVLGRNDHLQIIERTKTHERMSYLQIVD
jgi:hypothetical protein